MPIKFFERKSRESTLGASLETADPDRLMVLDIVESYLSPIIIPYPPLVFRAPRREGQSCFIIELPEPINHEIESKLLYVKFKKNSHGRTEGFISMKQPSSTRFVLKAPDRLYNWTKYMGPNYRYGPITIQVEDSVEGRWLSMAMHIGFGQDYADLRMRQSILEKGENVTLTGPRPDGWYALGCEGLWKH